MQRLATTLSQARDEVAAVGHDADRATLAIDRLEDAGAQVGRLQVGCCAPNRLPLYAELLEGLTTAQLEVSRALYMDERRYQLYAPATPSGTNDGPRRDTHGGRANSVEAPNPSQGVFDLGSEEGIEAAPGLLPRLFDRVARQRIEECLAGCD